jgi:hypothetical protein
MQMRPDCRTQRTTCPLILGQRGFLICALALALFQATAAGADGAEVWSVKRAADAGRMDILLDGKPFAEYSFRDASIPRPYFANITAPSGVRITRNHPLTPEDPQDHEKIHPGMWLAFGDISGADCWRLTAPVEHARFISEPAAKGHSLSFAVENVYRDSSGSQEICREACHYVFQKTSDGILVLWNSAFRSDSGSFAFGDQEELGLGVRMNRDVAVAGGGRILNSNGQRNEREAWSKQADWCDYSGTVGGQFVGITIMPHPENFRQAWCHCRDNGFMAMNPFGRNAFTGGEKSAIDVKESEVFRLRYGVMIHWSDSPDGYDPARVYRKYQEVAN